jgi:hypothetical protein
LKYGSPTFPLSLPTVPLSALRQLADRFNRGYARKVGILATDSLLCCMLYHVVCNFDNCEYEIAVFNKFEEAEQFIEKAWRELRRGVRFTEEYMIQPKSPFVALKENFFNETKATTFYFLPPEKTKDSRWWTNNMRDEMKA